MASVYLQAGRSKNWVARFKGPDGRWTARSTGQTNRAAALKLAFLWEGNLTDDALADPTAARIDQVVRSIYEGVTGSKIEKAPTGVYLREWAERTGKLKSPGTATRYAQVIEDFLAFMGERRAAGNLSTGRPLDIQRFIDARLAKGHAASSAAIVRKVLRIPFNVALRQGVVTRNPALSVEVPEEAAMTREAFTFEQIDAILRIADTEWRTAILLGAYTGMRLGDAVSLTWRNVDLANKTITFVPEKTSRGRRRKELVLPIHPTLLKHLNSLPGADRDPAAVVISGLGSRRIGGRSGLSRDFVALVTRAGIECEAVERKRGEGVGGRKFRTLSFHSLRHTFNSMLANAGVDQEVRQQLTGHASAEMNRRYTHLELKTMRDAILKLPGWRS